MSEFDYKTFIEDLWFLPRDIVSDGYDEALRRIVGYFPVMKIHEYPSGMEAWTWIIPQKWSVRSAYIKDANGKELLNLRDHPLHVLSYSNAIDTEVSHEELMSHLHSRPERPNAIPFEFSYYERTWGFCIQHARRPAFQSKTYRVFIDAFFKNGRLKVGDLFIKGKTNKEIVIMAHLCHPCMAEDDLSGVAVLLAIARKLLKKKEHVYSYRFLLFPETIGSIAYLSQNEKLISNMQFGIFLEMLGHDDVFSLQHSKQHNTRIDKAASLSLQEKGKLFREGTFREVIGNDERVLNGPGVNIPSISLSRSKFWGKGEWPYPEYHSSDDTPAIISTQRLREAEELVLSCIDKLEKDFYPRSLVKGPICLSRYGLWIDWRKAKELNIKQAALHDMLADGTRSVIEIAHELNIPYDMLYSWLEALHERRLISKHFHHENHLYRS